LLGYFIFFIGDEMPNTLSEIQKEIKKTGAKWVAGETEISRLPEDQRLRLVASGPLIKPATFRPVPKPQPTPLPPALDWTNYNGKNYVTSIKFQEGSSCTVWSATAALESAVLKSGIVPLNTDINLSEHAIGASPESGLPNQDYISSFIKDTGLPTEDWFTGNPPSGKPGWRDHTYRISHWEAYAPKTINDVKNILSQYGPLLTGMNVTRSFLDTYSGGIWSNSTNEATVGGHAVLIVGYDDTNQCFRVKNSWGKGWGESHSGVHTAGDNGFFRIAYSEFQRSPADFGWDLKAYFAAIGPNIPPYAWPNGKKINATDIATGIPSTCRFNNRIFLFWRGVLDKFIWFSTSTDGITWSQGKKINASDISPASPAACVYNNKIYLFWKGALDESIWFSASANGNTWPQGKKINASDISPASPAACVYNNKIYLFWRGARDESMWFSASTDGNTWPQGKKINASDISIAAPSACVAFDKIYLFWRGARDESMWFSASTDGNTWPQGKKINASDIAPGAPSASCELLYNKIYLFWRGARDESMWFSASTNGNTWPQGKKINASDISPDAPSVCVFDHMIYLFWKGARDENMWFSAL
jgi:hypothetical protein